MSLAPWIGILGSGLSGYLINGTDHTGHTICRTASAVPDLPGDGTVIILFFVASSGKVTGGAWSFYSSRRAGTIR